MVKSNGRTVLLVSHNLDLVAKECDKALLMDQGKLVAFDKPDAVIETYYQLNKEVGK